MTRPSDDIERVVDSAAKALTALQDDIDNGSRIDCTLKPGFYVRQYKTWRQAAYGDCQIGDHQ